MVVRRLQQMVAEGGAGTLLIRFSAMLQCLFPAPGLAFSGAAAQRRGKAHPTEEPSNRIFRGKGKLKARPPACRGREDEGGVCNRRNTRVPRGVQRRAGEV